MAVSGQLGAAVDLREQRLHPFCLESVIDIGRKVNEPDACSVLGRLVHDRPKLVPSFTDSIGFRQPNLSGLNDF